MSWRICFTQPINQGFSLSSVNAWQCRRNLNISWNAKVYRLYGCCKHMICCVQCGTWWGLLFVVFSTNKWTWNTHSGRCFICVPHLKWCKFCAPPFMYIFLPRFVRDSRASNHSILSPTVKNEFIFLMNDSYWCINLKILFLSCAGTNIQSTINVSYKLSALTCWWCIRSVVYDLCPASINQPMTLLIQGLNQTLISSSWHSVSNIGRADHGSK